MSKVYHFSVIFLIGLFIFSLYPQKSHATDWAYRFVVWQDTIYVVGEETVTDIEEEIGHVTKYSDMESYGGNFSNAYPKGTKYYSIKGIDTDVAIAVQEEDGVFVKAESNGPYEYREWGIYHYLLVGLALFAVIIVGAVIYDRKAN